MASLDGNIALTLHLILYKDTPVAVGSPGSGAKAENRAQPRLDVVGVLATWPPPVLTHYPTAIEELQRRHNILRRRLCSLPYLCGLPPTSNRVLNGRVKEKGKNEGISSSAYPPASQAPGFGISSAGGCI